MAAPRTRLVSCAVLCASVLAFFLSARADEIRLKDGKKLYGSIVGYEDNMFKVKTDFGFVLVEKDKIASIIPSAPAPASKAAAGTSTPPSSNKSSASPGNTNQSSTTETRAASAGASQATPSDSAPSPYTNVPVASRVTPMSPVEQPPAKTFSVKDSKPALPSSSVKTVAAPALNLPAAAKSPAAPLTLGSKSKPVEPVNREVVQGNEYINYTQGFRMYKPPSWKLIADAHQVLPNAVVAMGTSDESTLMVVSQEKSQDSLDIVAADVQKRLRDIYSNYRRVSQRKTVAGGFPAIEIHYRGLADEHDWSGTLMVVSRGPQIFSILGMTYSGTDLIQIQENVIARAISSLEFTPN